MTLAGAIAGLVALLGLVALAAGYRAHRRNIEQLRAWAGHRPEQARAAAGTASVRGLSAPRRTALVAAGVTVVLGYAALAYALINAGADDPRPLATAPTPRVDDLTDLSRKQRQAIPVAVLNGSSIAGLAERTASRLAALGFARGDIGNAPTRHRGAPTVAYADADAAGPALAIAKFLNAPRPSPLDRATRASAGAAEVAVTVGRQ